MTAICRTRRPGGRLELGLASDALAAQGVRNRAAARGEPASEEDRREVIGRMPSPCERERAAQIALRSARTDAAIRESRYDSAADRLQLRVSWTLPGERARAAGRRLPGRIVYLEVSLKDGILEDEGVDVDGMETKSRLTYREAVSVERAFAGGAER
jgi:hypothetical protein